MIKKIILLLAIIMIFGILINLFFGKHEKPQEKPLEFLYEEQNHAFLIKCTYEESQHYQNSGRCDLPRLVVYLYVYNNVQDNYKLTVDEVLDYLSEEKNSDNKPNVYSRPDAINDYINSFPEVKESAIDFSDYFIEYMKETGQGKYWEMDYKDVIEALDQYKNDPRYEAPKPLY